MNTARTNGVGSRRSTKRITLRIPVTVSGRDEHGSVFADQVLMENASKEGGCFWFTRDLGRKQYSESKGRMAAVSWPTSDGVATTPEETLGESAFSSIQPLSRDGSSVMPRSRL